MPTEVVDADGIESSESEQPSPQATPVEGETTWKARLAGKDRALTDAKKELERLQKEAADLSRWKAEREQADMTEVQRLQQRITALESEKAAAEQSAQRFALKQDYPLTFATLGDSAPLDPAALAEIETRLVALKGESESEPLVDRNNPRRSSPAAPKPIDKKSADELEGDLAGFGNPFKDAGFAFKTPGALG